MAFCTNCGAELGDGVRFCPQCGREMGVAPGTAAPTGDASGAPVAGGLQPNVAGLLCYVGWFVTGIIFLVLEPHNRDPFIRFHAFQAIFFAVAVLVCSIVLGFIPFVGWALYPLFWLAVMVLWVILMVQAYQNKKWKLPVIGDLAEKQG